MVNATVARIQALQEEADDLIHRYLLASGWWETSSNPSHFVLWTLAINGRLVTCSKDMAFRIQQDMEAYAESGMTWVPGTGMVKK